MKRTGTMGDDDHYFESHVKYYRVRDGKTDLDVPGCEERPPECGPGIDRIAPSRRQSYPKLECDPAILPGLGSKENSLWNQEMAGVVSKMSYDRTLSANFRISSLIMAIAGLLDEERVMVGHPIGREIESSGAISVKSEVVRSSETIITAKTHSDPGEFTAALINLIKSS